MTTTLELIVKAQKLVKPVPKVVNEKGQPAPDSAGILSEWHRVSALVGLSLIPSDYTIERGGLDEKGRGTQPMISRSFLFGGGSPAFEHRTQWLIDQRESSTLSQAAALSMGLTYCLRDVLLIPCPEPVKKEYGPPKAQEKPSEEAPKTVLKPETKGGKPGQGFDSGVARTPPPPMSEWELPEKEPEAKQHYTEAAHYGKASVTNNATTGPGEASSPGEKGDSSTGQASRSVEDLPAKGSVVAPSKDPMLAVVEAAPESPDGVKKIPARAFIEARAEGETRPSPPVPSGGERSPETPVSPSAGPSANPVVLERSEASTRPASEAPSESSKSGTVPVEGGAAPRAEFPCRFCKAVLKKKAAQTMHERACELKAEGRKLAAEVAQRAALSTPVAQEALASARLDGETHVTESPEASQGSAEPQEAMPVSDGVESPDVVRQGLAPIATWKDESS